MTPGEKYVAAAYAVVLLAVLLWVAIIATKLVRLERELSELTTMARRSPSGDG
jgi:type II secretory pathway component PulM